MCPIFLMASSSSHAGDCSGDSQKQRSHLPPFLKRRPSPLPLRCLCLATTSLTPACRAKSGFPSTKMSTAHYTSRSSSPFWSRCFHTLSQPLLPFTNQPLEGDYRVDLHLCVHHAQYYLIFYCFVSFDTASFSRMSSSSFSQVQDKRNWGQCILPKQVSVTFQILFFFYRSCKKGLATE